MRLVLSNRWLTEPVQLVPCLNLSVIECSLGIMCVSIPPLRPLAARIWPKDMAGRLRGSSRSTSAKSPLHSLSLTKRSLKPQSDVTNPTEHNSQTGLCQKREERLDHEMESRPYTNTKTTSEMQSQSSSSTCSNSTDRSTLPAQH